MADTYAELAEKALGVSSYDASRNSQVAQVYAQLAVAEQLERIGDILERRMKA